MEPDYGVLDLSGVGPEILCIDTSAAGRLLFEDEPQHRQYVEFVTRSIQSGTTFVYSELLDLELAQLCIKAARRLHEGRRADALPAGRRLIESTFARWNQLIAQTTSDRATLAGGDHPLQVGSPIRAAAFYLIKEHGLESYDATHAATAINYGAPLLTADQDFAHIPAALLTLLTDSDQTDEFRARRRRGS